MSKSKKKNIKVRDINPKKDAKGGGVGGKGTTGTGLDKGTTGTGGDKGLTGTGGQGLG